VILSIEKYKLVAKEPSAVPAPRFLALGDNKGAVNMSKIFFDTEFTGLHQNTTLISIGLISDCGKTFYAEFTDYDKCQVNDWLMENVISELKWFKNNGSELTCNLRMTNHLDDVYIYGKSSEIKVQLIEWLKQFESVKIWSDCLAYDWVLFNTLLADYSNGYPVLPSNINYIPFDICTLFEANGIDPDINREKFCGYQSDDSGENKHNALHDAIVIKKCYEKLINAEHVEGA
jgi:hypothetical protein